MQSNILSNSNPTPLDIIRMSPESISKLTQNQANVLKPEHLMLMTKEQIKSYVIVMMGEQISNISKERNYDADLPEPIDTSMFYQICKENWNRGRITMADHITPNCSTIPEPCLINCGNIIKIYLRKRKSWLGDKIKILEPFAGNGVASKIIYSKLIQKNIKIKYVATDLQNLRQIVNPNLSIPVEFGIDCIDSICKHENECEILMLVCPPPSTYNLGSVPEGFGDYYSLKKWTELNKKVFIFVGELGRTDGTEGMYKFLMNHPIWKLVEHKVLQEGDDIFERHISRDIFIFENSNRLN